MNKKKIVVFSLLIGLVVLALFSSFIYKAMFKANTSFTKKEHYIYIPTNSNYTTVRTILKPFLKNISSFDALAKRKKYTQNVKPGRYKITKGMNNNQIINTIRSKNLPVSVSFNNQNSLEKLAGRVAAQIEPDSTQILATMLDSSFLKTNNFKLETALEMYIPNSYQLFWNSSATTFRDKMLKEYNTFWNESRITKAKKIGFSKHQVITLAAIVHEESKQKSEQPRIAGVYINRLHKGMPLQADPTIKYAAYQLPENKNKVIKRILNKHKTINSPYNTYLHQGLPPGPIAMPDISAIDAVLNYEKHNFLYFVADSKRIGFHKFAKTLAQHNANARTYHAYLNANGIR